MLKFVSVGKAMPDKRAPATRRADFQEIFREYRPDHAAEQAGCCSQCGVPFCQVHCPVHNNIPDWLKLTAEGRLEEAMRPRPPPTTSRRSAAASAPRTGCAKATA
jgi:glutamate synthase (NADPH/NADH) small chain